MRGSLPVWLIDLWEGAQQVVSARDGRRVGPADAGEARRIAAAFGHAPVRTIASLERD